MERGGGERAGAAARALAHARRRARGPAGALAGGGWHLRAHRALPLERTGTRVLPASGTDAHNNVERYAWKIVDAKGSEVMEGLDVAERDDSGRLRRILMFHGRLPAGD